MNLVIAAARVLALALGLAVLVQGAAFAISPALSIYTVFFDFGRTTISSQGDNNIRLFIEACERRGAADQIAIMAYTDSAEASEASSSRRCGSRSPR